jgi:hypothetical protein
VVRDRVGVGLDAFARGYATLGLLGLGLLPLVLLLFPDGHLPTPAGDPWPG